MSSPGAAVAAVVLGLMVGVASIPGAALAQELDAELWTLDGPLARNASGADLPVRLIELS